MLRSQFGHGIAVKIIGIAVPDFCWVQDYRDEICMGIDILEEQVFLSEFESWYYVF